MYRLMIVEDEPIERESLRMMVQINCEDICTVEVAENGFEALRKCREFPPNIVIIDLNMPGMDGLETIRELQKLDESIRFLILSAYNRFEFAQEAIKLGVEDFIVKPAGIADIKKSIRGIIGKIEQFHSNTVKNTILAERMEEIRPILESDFIHAVVAQKNEEEVRSFLAFLEFHAETGFCFTVSYENRPRVLLARIKEVFEGMGITCLGEQYHNLLVFFMLSSGQLEERRRAEVGGLVKMLLMEEERVGCNVGIGSIYLVKDLYQSYKEAISAMEQGGVLCLYCGDSHREQKYVLNLNNTAREIVENLNGKGEFSTKVYVDWIMTELFLKKSSPAESRELLYRLMTIISSMLQGIHPDMELKFPLSLEAVLKSTSSQEAEAYCACQLNNLQEALTDYKKLNHNLIIQRALHYVDKHFEKNISLNDVAGELQISIYYLSKICKKHTGKNFTDILAERRIQEAKILLKQQYSIKEVTYRVGFNSQNYFTKVFKKYVGCTPSEFRG